MESIVQIITVVLLVFLNGFFVASEFALVAVRKTKVAELVKKGNKAALILEKALEDLDSFISATQLGITLASLGLGWMGEPAIAKTIMPLLSFLPKSLIFISAHTIAGIVAFTIITFLHIVLGELVPKTIALQRSEATSLILIFPLTIFVKIFWPFIVVLNSAGSMFLRLFGFSAPKEHQLVHSEEEIKMILDQSLKGGVIPKDEVEMVRNVFRLGDIPISSIMIPRTDIVAFDLNTKLNVVIDKLEKNLHSRYPIYKKTIDVIVGFVHVKDIYKVVLKSSDNKKLVETNLIRNIIHVPEGKKADDVLVDMRNNRVHLAVVNDEYGGTAGIATLEDIIESLVGEIQDEFDYPQKEIRLQKDGSFLISGKTPVEKVQNKLHFSLKGQGYTTIGGLVFGLLGREPNIGDEVQISGVTFEVVKMSGDRITLLRSNKKRS